MNKMNKFTSQLKQPVKQYIKTKRINLKFIHILKVGSRKATKLNVMNENHSMNSNKFVKLYNGVIFCPKNYS